MIMDKDRIKGAAKEVSGSIKEAAGKITGDRETEAKGKVEKNVGTAQNAFGKVKDAIRNA
jgi:uncharacterized protein YjbJ (UPF0337 family)